MISFQPGMGEMRVSEDVVQKVLSVDVVSLSDISGDGLALLTRQLEMARGSNSKIKVIIPQAPTPNTPQADNLGMIAGACSRFSDKNLTIRYADTGKEVEVRVAWVP